MSKQTANKQTAANVGTVGEYSTLKAFGSALQRAAKAEVSAATKVLNTVLAARGVDVESKANAKAVREVVAAVFESAGTPSAKKRTADAMAILGAPADQFPADLPGNLQRAADAVRQNRPADKRTKRAAQNTPDSKGRKASKKATSGAAVEPDRDVSMDDAVRLIRKQIEAIRRHAADSEVAGFCDSLESILDEPSH